MKFQFYGQTTWLPAEAIRVESDVKVWLFLINIPSHSPSLFSSRVANLYTNSSLVIPWLFLLFLMFLSLFLEKQMANCSAKANHKCQIGLRFLTLKNMRIVILRIVWCPKCLLAYGLFYFRDFTKWYLFPVKRIENDFDIMLLKYFVKWLHKVRFLTIMFYWFLQKVGV